MTSCGRVDHLLCARDAGPVVVAVVLLASRPVNGPRYPFLNAKYAAFLRPAALTSPALPFVRVS